MASPLPPPSGSPVGSAGASNGKKNQSAGGHEPMRIPPYGGEHQQIIIIQVTIVMRHKEQSAQNVTTITGIHAYCSFKKNKRAFGLSLMTTLMTTPAHRNFRVQKKSASEFRTASKIRTDGRGPKRAPNLRSAEGL